MRILLFHWISERATAVAQTLRECSHILSPKGTRCLARSRQHDSNEQDPLRIRSESLRPHHVCAVGLGKTGIRNQYKSCFANNSFAARKTTECPNRSHRFEASLRLHARRGFGFSASSHHDHNQNNRNQAYRSKHEQICGLQSC